MLMVDRYIEKDLPSPHESGPEDIYLPTNYKPQREDVICSRGSISYHHAANIRLRELIDESLEDYELSKSKVERSAMVSKIIESVQGNHGRFVRQDPKTKRWFQVRNRTTREKVGQAIRAALKKRQQMHDSQFAIATAAAGGQRNRATSSPNILGATETYPHQYKHQRYDYALDEARAGLSPTTAKLHDTSSPIPLFSSPTRSIPQLRHDTFRSHVDNQDLHYFDTIPVPGTTNAPPAASAYANLRHADMQSQARALSNYRHFGQTSQAIRPYAYQNSHMGIGRTIMEGSSYQPRTGVDDFLYARQRVPKNVSLSPGIATTGGVFPGSELDVRDRAFGLLERQEDSRGFATIPEDPRSLRHSHQQSALDAQGFSSWNQSARTSCPDNVALGGDGYSNPELSHETYVPPRMGRDDLSQSHGSNVEEHS